MLTHLLMTIALLAPAADKPASRPAATPFFAMDVATKDEKHQSLESQLQMLKELGYDGYAMNADAGVPEALKLADAMHLRLFAIYTGVDIGGKNPPWNPKLPEIIRALKGHQTAIWVFVTSTPAAATDDVADARAVAAIRQVADMAEESGLHVSLYPHYGFYMASARHGIRLVKKTDRRNVKLTFNLCHWLRTDGGKDLEPILRESLPWLDIVNINGTDREGNDWDRLIQPLGQGDFDVYGLLVKLRNLGFKGPIGLQGYGIKGDIHKILADDIRVWREYQVKLARRGRAG